jgi:hypothetical protein
MFRELLGYGGGDRPDSTSPAARDFATEMWLSTWMERPQPSLGDKNQPDLINTSA